MPVASQELTLSTVEWHAVSAALTDAADCGYRVSTARAGRFTRVFRKLSGSRPRAVPADPRLEAVRRFVCAANRSRRLPEAQVPGLLDYGFNRQQIDALALLSV